MLQFFPEGGFYKNRLAGSHRFAERHGLKKLNHVALPRTNGFSYILDELAKNNMIDRAYFNRSVKWCVRLTVIYPDQKNPWDLYDMITGSKVNEETFIDVKVCPVNSIPLPTPDDGKGISEKVKQPFESWLMNEYGEMDKTISGFYESNGGNLKNTMEVKMKLSKMVLAYIIGIFSAFCIISSVTRLIRLITF